MHPPLLEEKYQQIMWWPHQLMDPDSLLHSYMKEPDTTHLQLLQPASETRLKINFWTLVVIYGHPNVLYDLDTQLHSVYVTFYFIMQSQC